MEDRGDQPGWRISMTDLFVAITFASCALACFRVYRASSEPPAWQVLAVVPFVSCAYAAIGTTVLGWRSGVLAGTIAFVMTLLLGFAFLTMSMHGLD